MKNLLIFGFFILVLVFAQFVQAQTVDDVIKKHIAALGGMDKINRIQQLIMDGSLQVGGNELIFKITRVNNKLYRTDVRVKDVQGFEMLTTQEGWEYRPFDGMQKPEQKSAQEVSMNQDNLDIAGCLVNYAAKGYQVELMGKEDVDGLSCYKIKAVLGKGKIRNYFIDPATSMIVRTIEPQVFNGLDMELQFNYADYRMVEGVKMPFSISREIGTILISNIQINPVIPESAFKNGL